MSVGYQSLTVSAPEAGFSIVLNFQRLGALLRSVENCSYHSTISFRYGVEEQATHGGALVTIRKIPEQL